MVSGDFLDTFSSCHYDVKVTRATADGWFIRNPGHCWSEWLSLSPTATKTPQHTSSIQSVRLIFLSLKTHLKHIPEHRNSPSAAGDAWVAVKPSGLGIMRCKKEPTMWIVKKEPIYWPALSQASKTWVPPGWASVGRHPKHLRATYVSWN